jgi:uncharacterized protein
MSDKPPVGSVTWFDLTVDDAESIRDFYAEVIGWVPSPVPMGDYNDFSMNSPSTDDPITGVCFARGGNAHLPPVWMVYVNVEDLDASVDRCKELGGELIGEIRSMESMGRYCAIKDPAGAVLSLFEPT